MPTNPWPKNPKPVPHFESEEEELRFWDEHDPSDYIEGPSDIVIRLKRNRKKPVTIRLEQSLYDELREVAARHGVPYQSLMRELLRQSLTALARKEKREAAV